MCSSQATFRAQHADDAWVALARLPQRPRRRFERAFEHVMRVAPAQTINVQVAAYSFGERAPEMLGQFDREVADHLPARLDLIDEIETPGQIDDRATQSLIHWHKRRAIARHAMLIAKRLPERCAQRDRNVFDRMMIVNLKIAATLKLKIKQAMTRKQLK